MALSLPLLRERSIVGVYWGEWTKRAPGEFAAALEQLGDWFAQGRLRPHVSATYRLDEAARALKDMAERRVMGKVVLLPDS